MKQDSSLELAHVASSTRPLGDRAHGMLGQLRRLVPFDAAWLALADPQSGNYTSLASVDLDEETLGYLSGPRMAADIEMTQTDRAGPPLSPSDLPYPAEDLATWAECLHPGGIHEALAVALYDRSQRHVGFLALLSGSTRPPALSARRRLHRLAPVLARGVDPVRGLAAAARVVTGASAGAVLRSDRHVEPLPGLDGDALLEDESPVVAVAWQLMDEGQVLASFLWPRDGGSGPDAYVRVTVLARSEEPSTSILGAVVLSPLPDLRGLTPRELEVLGLLVDGRSNQQIAHVLFVSPRTVAAHLEHILVKLGAPTRTLAAVRAERQGLYVPLAATQLREEGAGERNRSPASPHAPGRKTARTQPSSLSLNIR